MKTLLKLSCAVYMLLAANVMCAQDNVRPKGLSEEELGEQAIALYNQGKCDESIEVLKKVLVINPSNASACNIIGCLYKEKFENDLKVINERHYDNDEDRDADIETANSDCTNAIAYFEKAIELNPNNPNTYEFMGYLYMTLVFNELKIINERHYTVEADRQADIKKTVNSNGKEAVRYFEKVTELNPDDEDARNTLQAVREYLNEKSQNL